MASCTFRRLSPLSERVLEGEGVRAHFLPGVPANSCACQEIASRQRYHADMRSLRILVTGATGYIGGRLIPRLLDAGHYVRVLVRNARRIEGRPWASRVEVVEGDLLEPATLPRALDGL